MLKQILFISGKPGLYRLVSRGKNMLIVESLADKKRVPAHANDHISSLNDIAIYTDEGEKKLADIFQDIYKKEGGKSISIDTKDKKALFDYFATILPDFDRERVYADNVKKIILWYNILVEAGFTTFEEKEEEEEEKTEA